MITVRGTGTISVKPDLTVLNMNLDTRHTEYSKCMKLANKEIEALRDAFEKIGFEHDSLKTTDFRIAAEYKRHKDTSGNYHELFDVWSCRHDLKLEFPLDADRLSEVLTCIAKCETHPKFKVKFSIADKNSICEELLKNATENAKRKAEILCESSGVTLGEIVNINYNWGEVKLFSDTEYDDDFLTDRICSTPVSIHIDPEEIKNSDSVTLVWSIA